jgi:hypothetical protein
MLKINNEEEKVTVKNILLTTATLGFCLILSFFAPTAASADWGFGMSANGSTLNGGFSKIELFIQNAGETWSGNGASNFSEAQWSATKINPTYVLAASTTKTKGTLSWDTLFTGMKTDSFTLDYLVYKNNNNNYNQAYGMRMSTVDGGKTFTYAMLNPGTFSSYNRSPVAAPVPPSVFLLGAGLIGVVVLRKRVRG